jgi:Uma2 family endonuclease
VIEVVSASPSDERRDRVEKMAEYADFGISQYWLVDPALGSFEVFVLGDTTYTRAVGVTTGVITGLPRCDGLSIDVDALWHELESLAEED